MALILESIGQRFLILRGLSQEEIEESGKAIYLAWTKGCRFDGWNETFNHEAWIEAVDEAGIESEYMLGTIPVESRLPWDHIRRGP